MRAVSHWTVCRVARLEKRGLRPEEKEIRRIIRRKKESCFSRKGDRRNGRMKTKEVIKILEENKLTNIQKKKKEEEDWWERHKSFIEYRKKFPYDPDKNKK